MQTYVLTILIGLSFSLAIGGVGSTSSRPASPMWKRRHLEHGPAPRSAQFAGHLPPARSAFEFELRQC